MDYNVPGGKLDRDLSVVDSVAILLGRELTDSEYFKAAVLGWAVEWVRLFLFPPFPGTARPGMCASAESCKHVSSFPMT
jgi:hypothetical protein